MPVIKRKDLDWKSYLQELCASDFKVSDTAKIELAGFLLKRDMEKAFNKARIIQRIACKNGNNLSSIIINFLLAESPESSLEVLKGIKYSIYSYYENEINSLIKLEESKEKYIETAISL